MSPSDTHGDPLVYKSPHQELTQSPRLQWFRDEYFHFNSYELVSTIIRKMPDFIYGSDQDFFLIKCEVLKINLFQEHH